MNLFENLQLMKELENSIISEFKEFLVSKNAQYIANEIGETKDGMQIVIYDGDWKHEHAYMKRLLDEFFTEKGIDISITSEEIGESEQDTYSARYDIIFNAKPKTYTSEIIDEVIEPSNFSPDGRCYYNDPSDWKEKHEWVANKLEAAGYKCKGRSRWKSIWTNGNPKEDIEIDYWMDFDIIQEIVELSTIGLVESVDTSNWKQRFKGIDAYISDKYPEYQIIKSYTSSEQEVWQVLNFKTQREVFCSGTFEGAIEFVEKKSNLKESIESNSFQIGEEYEWSGLYGGSYTGIIKEIDEESITLDVSWTAEDTGKLVQKEMTYDLETDSEGNIAFIVWRYSGEKGYVYPKNKSFTESVENDINLDDYEYISTGTGYNKGWSLYRKIVDGKGVWVAEHQQTKEIVPINYDQVQGFEPIKLDGVKKLQKDLGDILLPKRESDDNYDDNAATFLDTLESEVTEAAHKYMLSVGFPEDEVDDYLSVSTDINDDYVMVAVGAELGYESISNLCDELNKIIEKHDKDAYFEPECPGRIVAYLFGYKKESVDDIETDEILIETNHNEILDKDYTTGEKIYNELKDYLNSLDQIAMDGNDCNWEPSEFNAKNLNADGEIYLECGAYILIYPYINEWAEDYFKIIVMDAETCELSTQLKNAIEEIVNKFKTDKWKLIFEG